MAPTVKSLHQVQKAARKRLTSSRLLAQDSCCGTAILQHMIAVTYQIPIEFHYAPWFMF